MALISNFEMQQLQGPQNPELREVLENYIREIKELTFNSKLIINNLTIIAEENKQVAAEIVNIIDNRLQTAPKDQCLPSLYLLDSITKNIGEPYLSLFAKNLVNNFVNTYLSVNEKTQESMIHLLKTWQTIFPTKYSEIIALLPPRASNNRPVGIDAAKEVLSASKLLPPSHSNANPISYPLPVAATTIANPPLYSVNIIPPSPVPLVANSLLSQNQIYSSLPNNNQPSFTSPNLNYGQNFNAFNQTLQLQQIYASLLSQMNSAATSLINPPIQPMPTPHAASESPYTTSYMNNIAVSNTNMNTNINISHNINNTQSMNSVSLPNVTPTNNHPNQSSNTSPPSASVKPVYNIPKNGPRPAKTIGTAFSRDIIKAKTPYIIDDLYHENWSQCTTCAYRFPDPSKFSDHLDWHFKINRREKEKLKKPLSREWFLPAEEWVNYEGAEIVQKPSPNFFPSSPDGVKEEKKNYIKKDDDQNDCPVCGESFESIFEPDEEEWMFIDVLKKDGVIYHVACVQEDTDYNPSATLLSKRTFDDSENADDSFNKRSKYGIDE